MTEFTGFRSRTRDVQDGNIRGVWGQREEVDGAGSVLTIRGPEDWLDEEVPILNVGYSFNLPKDSNAEVLVLAVGNDPNDKVALPTLGRDVQHAWPEGTGGVQNPTDPERRLEFNGDETWLKDGNYKLGDNKEVEISIDGGKVTINISADTEINVPNLNVKGDMKVEGKVEIEGDTLTHNGKNVGDDHKHSGVDTGAGNTGDPV